MKTNRVCKIETQSTHEKSGEMFGGKIRRE